MPVPVVRKSAEVEYARPISSIPVRSQASIIGVAEAVVALIVAGRILYPFTSKASVVCVELLL